MGLGFIGSVIIRLAFFALNVVIRLVGLVVSVAIRLVSLVLIGAIKLLAWGVYGLAWVGLRSVEVSRRSVLVLREA